MWQSQLVINAVLIVSGLFTVEAHEAPTACQSLELCPHEAPAEAGSSFVQGVFHMSKLPAGPQDQEASQLHALSLQLTGERNGNASRITGTRGELKERHLPPERPCDPLQVMFLLAVNTTQRLPAAIRLGSVSSILQRGASGQSDSKPELLLAAGAVMFLVGTVFCVAALSHSFREQARVAKPETPVRSPAARLATSASACAPPSQSRAAPTSTLHLRPAQSAHEVIAALSHSFARPSSREQAWAVERESSAQSPVAHLLTPATASAPPSLRHLAPASASQFLAVGSHLSSELVVPEGSVCNLFVPTELPSSTSSNTMIVKDVCGEPILKASFAFDTARNGRPFVSNVVLRGVPNDLVFASCRCAEDSGYLGFTICRHSGSSFASLRADGPGMTDRFSVSTLEGLRIRFDREGCSLRAADDHGDLLAIAETHGDRRFVRVGPLVDVGLIVL
eukprot:CAMPEP_0179149634 /NCGR_PEP_ID=MMETSP0796-20121207/72505_1 /TAXON_ID=73915 /ORGANISM="Pyrodinium bahamense, Strain pbaha01" /LENGTH=450 /DNA_ID=CAMNT_0020850499 /DNA_START=43 /DNA_END=1392 /DNA_ORIENTATION=+